MRDGGLGIREGRYHVLEMTKVLLVVKYELEMDSMRRRVESFCRCVCGYSRGSHFGEKTELVFFDCQLWVEISCGK